MVGVAYVDDFFYVDDFSRRFKAWESAPNFVFFFGQETPVHLGTKVALLGYGDVSSSSLNSGHT